MYRFLIIILCHSTFIYTMDLKKYNYTSKDTPQSPFISYEELQKNKIVSVMLLEISRKYPELGAIESKFLFKYGIHQKDNSPYIDVFDKEGRKQLKHYFGYEGNMLIKKDYKD